MRRTRGHSRAQHAGDRKVFWLGRSCCTARAWSSFLSLLQEVSSIDKTRNPFYAMGSKTMQRSPAFPPVLTSYKLREIARLRHVVTLGWLTLLIEPCLLSFPLLHQAELCTQAVDAGVWRRLERFMSVSRRPGTFM